MLYVGAVVASLLCVLAPSASAASDSPVAGTVRTLASPTRLLDTRIGLGAAKGPVAGGRSVTLQVAGKGGVPSTGVGAVVLNVTVTGALASGNVTVFADGSSKPSTSNLNYVKGQTVPNLVLAPVADDGKVVLAVSGGTTQLIADVSSYVVKPADGRTAAAAGTVQPVTPTRLLDTRVGLGAAKGAVTGGHTVSLQVAGRDRVPSTGVGAVILNVTVTGALATGNVAVYADGSSKPATSNLNYVKGQTVPNLVLAPVGADGKVELAVSGGTTQLIADVSAYELSGTALVSNAIVPVTPTRLLDTRSGSGAAKGAVTGGRSVTLQVAGKGGLPSSGVGAVVLNVTATGALAAGNVTVYADGASKPATSNLNYVKDQTVPNLVLAPVGADGKVVLAVSGGTTQLVADVSAYVRRADAAWAPATTVDPSRGGPTALSCTSPTFCAAVDSTGQALFYDGQSWSAPSAIDADGPLTGVSCSSDTACTAIDDQGRVTVWNGATWSVRVPVLGVSGPDGHMACARSGEVCVAAAANRVAIFDGTTWSTPTELDLGAGTVTSVSCASATFCAVGSSAGTVSTYVSGRWSDVTTVFPDQLGLSLELSCSADDFCVAAQSGLASSFDGSAWSAPVQVTATGRALSAVACVSGGACVTVDSTGRAFTYSDGTWTSGDEVGIEGPRALSCPQAGSCVALDTSGFATGLAGGSWTTPVAIDVPTGTLSEVSCTSATFCLAVDDHGAALTYDGVRWSAPKLIARDLTPASLSCTSSSFCVLGGYYGRLGVYENGVWSVTTEASGDEFVGVSCSSSLFCVAAGDNGEAVTWNGTSWSAPVDALHFSPRGINYAVSVSCPADGTCYVDDTSGGVWTLAHGSWGGPVVVTDSFTGAISCWAVGECRMSAQGGASAVMDNGVWGAHLDTAGYPGGGPIDSLDCVSAVFCGGAGGLESTMVSEYDGQTWRPGDYVTDQVNTPVAISCPTTSFCIAVAGDSARRWTS